MKNLRSGRERALLLSFTLALCGVYFFNRSTLRAEERDSVSASIDIDVDRVEGQISPVLYGQFDEFMFEGVKRGLTAELIRDRSFDEAPNAIGLPRYWEREPDDRNDDPGLHFHWDDAVYYSMRHVFMPERTGGSRLLWRRAGPAGKATRLRRSMMFSEIGTNAIAHGLLQRVMRPQR